MNRPTRMRHTLAALRVNGREFADLTGTTPNTVSRRLKGRLTIGRETALFYDFLHQLATALPRCGREMAIAVLKAAADNGRRRTPIGYETPAPTV